MELKVFRIDITQCFIGMVSLFLLIDFYVLCLVVKTEHAVVVLLTPIPAL